MFCISFLNVLTQWSLLLLFTSFLSVTSSFSNKHPLEIECSNSVGGALTIIARERAEQWVCLQLSITVDFYLKTMTSQRESIETLETNSIGSKRTKKKAKTHNGDYYIKLNNRGRVGSPKPEG